VSAVDAVLSSVQSHQSMRITEQANDLSATSGGQGRRVGGHSIRRRSG
jgi:hypothetical protein